MSGVLSKHQRYAPARQAFLSVLRQRRLSELRRNLEYVSHTAEVEDGLRHLHPILSDLLAEGSAASPQQDFEARAMKELREWERCYSDVCWSRHLERIRKLRADFPPCEEILEGWGFLRAELGEKVWQSALSQLLWNNVPTYAIAFGRLGLLLESRKGKGGYGSIKQRLLSPEESDARGVLAELGVLWVLRSRAASDLSPTADVQLLHATRKAKCADIRVSSNDEQIDIEVSYLACASTYDASQQLEVRLQKQIFKLLAKHGLTMHVEIKCNGYAGNLFQYVDKACDEFEKRLEQQRPWEECLAPGMTFRVDKYPTVGVYVHGATVYSADPGATESPVNRLLAKVEEESPQVPEGGIVLICTSELSLPGVQAHAIYPILVERLIETGTRETNVAAFAILDDIGGSSSSTAFSSLPLDAELIEKDYTLGRQRLLWVPNRAHRSVSGQLLRKIREWLTPPLTLWS